MGPPKYSWPGERGFGQPLTKQIEPTWGVLDTSDPPSVQNNTEIGVFFMPKTEKIAVVATEDVTGKAYAATPHPLCA